MHEAAETIAAADVAARRLRDLFRCERPHRGLALLPPDSTNADPRPSGEEIKRRDRLGGLIHEYHRAAA